MMEAEENEMPKILKFFKSCFIKNEAFFLFHKYAFSSDKDSAYYDGYIATRELKDAFEFGLDSEFGCDENDIRYYLRKDFERGLIKGLSEWVAEKHQAAVTNG